jgi:hypothetical protein
MTQGFLDVYLNGIRLVNGSDFTASSGSSIVLTTGASASDILEVVAFGTFQLANFSQLLTQMMYLHLVQQDKHLLLIQVVQH